MGAIFPISAGLLLFFSSLDFAIPSTSLFEEERMALYLDEVWLKDPSPERMKEFVGLIGTAGE